jgi:putative salt-induced outer membrane protein YdiY
MKARSCLLIGLATLVASLPHTAAGEDEEVKTGWFDSAELSLVSTSGNSDAFTLGFANVLTRVWEKAEFRFELGAIRSQSRGDRYGVGALGAGNFVVTDPPRRVDTERYYGAASYSRTISSRFFWSVGVDGERNTPANIEYRVTGTAGVGNVWVDTDKVRFRTTYDLSYNSEDLTVEGTSDFAGFRLGYLYANKLTDNTIFDSQLSFDDNFDDLEDHRTDFYNAVTVSMSDRIALKAGLRLLYRNIPALTEIKIYDNDPEQGSATELGKEAVENENLDTNFSTSLVLTF